MVNLVTIRIDVSDGGGARRQRAATASPIIIESDDEIINFNIGTGTPVCTLPLFASRGGLPLTFRDAGGQAAAHNLTITITDLADGVGTLVMDKKYGEVTFTPYADGVNVGWKIS